MAYRFAAHGSDMNQVTPFAELAKVYSSLEWDQHLCADLAQPKAQNRLNYNDVLFMGHFHIAYVTAA